VFFLFFLSFVCVCVSNGTCKMFVLCVCVCVFVCLCVCVCVHRNNDMLADVMREIPFFTSY
jgi:threonine/homoserine/homoserine lactone efflux protein